MECKKQVAPEAFRIYEFRGNLPQALRAETGRVLSQWNDAGWGHLVADGKHGGRLGDELVDAIVEMIEERWRPNPTPEWVTCVPSLRHPELVPDFAKRVAASMDLPFVEAVRKVRENEAQKGQENRYHQCAIRVLSAADRRMIKQIDAMQERVLDEDELAGAFEAFDPMWDALTTAERERLVHLLVRSVEYDAENETIGVSFHAAEEGVECLT